MPRRRLSRSDPSGGRHRRLIMMVLVCLPFIETPPADGAELRVDASGGADFTSIQAALDAAESGDVVVVAPGTYVVTEPIDFNRLHDDADPNSPPRKNLTLRSASGPQRTTIEMAAVPDSSDRAAVVVFENGEGPESRLEGFRITGGGGVTSVGNENLLGGGVYCHINCVATIADCVIEGNSADLGGGIACSVNSSPTIVRCRVAHNRARFGAGVYCFSRSEPTFEECSVIANITERAAVGRGAGILCETSSPMFINSIIAGNRADVGGALACSTGSAPSFINCTIADNRAFEGGGVFCFADDGELDTPSFHNSIIWGNTGGSIQGDGDSGVTVSYSCVEGDDVLEGEGNIEKDPRFLRPGVWDGLETPDPADDLWRDGDYRLREDSPAINAAGSEDGSPTIDFAGRARPCGPATDMGAHENGPCFDQGRFLRGDVDGNGLLEITDPVVSLGFQFVGIGEPSCLDALDFDDSGVLDITDPIANLGHQFLGRPPPPPPHSTCGEDPTSDDLPCRSTQICAACDTPMDARGVGPCERFFGYTWNGKDCVGLSGCSCEGEECGELFAGREACLEAFAVCR